MCGLAGFYRRAGFSGIVAEATVRDLAGRLCHRGPDDEGTWLDEDAGIALGHRRLAILDLSPAGKQPMISAWENPNYGRYTLATLKEFAKAFDVGLLVRFVPFSKLVDWTVDLTSDVIAPASFSEEQLIVALPVSMASTISSSSMNI